MYKQIVKGGNVMINRIKKTRIADQVLEQLKEKIKNGDFPTGSKLPSENELARMFGVSRVPIREAISILSASGLVESIQGGGTFIKKEPTENLLDKVVYEMITKEEVYDLLELRMVIESAAAGLAAERRTESELKQIHEALLHLGEAVKNKESVGDLPDFEFHLNIVKASHNIFFIRTVENVRELYRKALLYSLKKNIGLDGKREQVYQEHVNIYEAIKNQDSEAASKYMRIHLENARRKLGDPNV